MTTTRTWEPDLTHAAVGLERLLRATAWSAIVLGALWALPAFGVLPDVLREAIDQWWPLVPVVAGAIVLARGHPAAGGVLAVVGLLLLIPRITPDGYGGQVLLVTIGLLVLAASLAERRLRPGTQTGMFEDVAVTLSEQTGGTTLAVFGEVQARMVPADPTTPATSRPSPAPRGLLAVFGSVRLEVPADLPVRVRGVAVFGDVRGPQACGDPRAPLEVTAVAVFGDVTIVRPG